MALCCVPGVEECSMTQPDPDPRTAADDEADVASNERAPNEGVSAQDPAEGADDTPGPDEGSPAG
jgi:hypothetical protein